MSKRYGLPYMGSKNKIAQWVLSYLPKAENFYDLFCGGCAITHCAIEQRKYKNYYINDIKGEMPQGFIDCINGKYADDTRWISHEEFDRLKGQGDLLVDVCFSFGNNWRKGYAYSREIEAYKKALHYAVVLRDYSLMKEQFGIDLSQVDMIKDRYKRYNCCKSLIGNKLHTGVESIERLERLQSLERLQIKGHIFASSLSYDEVEIKPNSVIYCDIPYRSTAKYNESAFDYNKFYEWCLKQTQPVFISEYEMPESDFICIAAKSKTCQLCASNNFLKSVEKIFIPKHQIQNKPLTLF